MTERTFEINVEDHMGFLSVFMGRGEPAGELAQFLSATLANWMLSNPKQRIVAVVPIDREGRPRTDLWARLAHKHRLRKTVQSERNRDASFLNLAFCCCR